MEEVNTVFISFSKQDSAAAREVEARLAGRRIAVWCDQHDYHSGPQWPKLVSQAISSSRLVLLLWSRDAAQSPFVEFEYTKALALNKAVIPCLLDATPVAPPLSGLDVVHFDDSDSGLSRLLERFEALGLAGGRRPQSSATGVDLLEGGDIGTILASPLNSLKGPSAGPSSAVSLKRPSEPDAGDLQIGDRYQVIRMLGRGGMGAVYRARDRELDRDVALKVIRADLASDPELLKRFKREIQLSSTVTHKNVLRVYDLGEGGGVKFLTMQYVDGEDLGSLLKREGKLPLPRLLHIFRQLCQGLAAAHEQGILHRDLKPANVMVGRDDSAYLTDFGLARSVAQSGLTQAGDVMGTPHYMSPEQVKGEQADVQSDIYSLGAILYEMTTGHVPFSGETIYEIMIQRIQKPPRPVTDLNPDTPPFLEKVIRRCMAVEKVARYTSVGELLRDLEHGTDTGRTLNASKFFLRRWRGALSLLSWKKAAIALPVVLLLVLAGLWLGRETSMTPAAPPVHEPVSVLIADFQNRTGDPLFNGSLEQGFETSLEGAPFITTFDRGQARRIASQLEKGASSLGEDAARLVATREGINVIIDGAIAAEGRAYEIRVRAIDASTGKEMASAAAKAATKEAVLPSVGRLSAEIRTTLGDTSPESAKLMAAETFTASSLEAALSYAAAQKLQGEGKWEEAIAAYNKTVELDPGLGRAYAGLAVAYRNLGRRDEAEKQYQAALQNIDRMTDREKYKTRGGYFLVIGNYPKAIEELTQLINNYPADFAGHTNLALAYFFTRKMGPAMEEARRATRIYHNNIVMRSNLALFSMYAGDFQGAAQLARDLLKTVTDRWRVYVCLALSELGQGNADAATEAYRKLEASVPSEATVAYAGLADLALFQGRFDDAVAMLQKGLAADRAERNESGAARKSLALAEAWLQLGKKDEALAAAGRAAVQDNQTSLLFEAARIYTAAGKSDTALEIAGRLGKGLRDEPRLYGKLIEGEVQLSQGKVWEAIKLFHEAQDLTDTWLGRFDLGRAYLEGSAYTEAYSELEQCTKRKGEAASIFLDDTPTLRYLPPAYYYLGRAQQGLGSPAATESYKTFLSMRGSADQDPLVVDARRRLASY